MTQEQQTNTPDPYEEFITAATADLAAPACTTTKHIRAPFHWLGGKGGAKIRAAVLANLPPHTCYVEPFGGTASILLNKPLAPQEIYNDINSYVVNFFRVLVAPTLFRQFYGILRNLPYSRDFYMEYNAGYRNEKDPARQAAMWYLVARQAFGGIMDHDSWGFGVSDASLQTASWLSSFDNLLRVRDRMQHVQIDNIDWRICLKRFCGDGYLAYCDPPYVMDTRKDAVYENEMSNSDHAELVQALMDYDGAVVLSGYDSPIYQPLLDGGWERKTFEIVCTCAGRVRNSKLQGEGACLKSAMRTECLWLNPEALRRRRQVQPSLFDQAHGQCV